MDSTERMAAFVVTHCQIDIPQAFTPNGDGIGDRKRLQPDPASGPRVACDTRVHAALAVQPAQNSAEARRAPSAIAANFAHTTSASTAAWPTHVP